MPAQTPWADTLTSNSGVIAAGASAQLVPASTTRQGLSVQVDPGGTGTVYLKLGTGTASAANFNFALTPGADWDGLAGGFAWRGPVQFFSAGTPNVAVTEF